MLGEPMLWDLLGYGCHCRHHLRKHVGERFELVFLASDEL